MRLYSHDPYRTRDATVPQVPPDAEPVERRLRVLAWVDRYPPFDNAGGEWALHHMLRPLVQAGHQVDVATRTPDGAGATLDGVRIHPDDRVAPLLERADVLVGHLFFTREVIHAAALAQLPLVYLFHNTFTVDHWNLTPNNLTVVVYNAEWVKDQTEGMGGLGGIPSAVVRPPVSLADYQVPDADHRRIFVTLVNPNPDKGGDVFYDLAERREHDQFLAVAGAYGQQRRPKANHSNVTWQHQTPRIRDDVYARTRVVLMPSRYESWGRVAVEAMCSGIPVIAHPTPGLIEALGEAAIFVDRDDLDGWCGALQALDDPDTYRRWSDAARARAAHLDALAAQDVATFERLVRLAAAAESVAGYAPSMTTPAYNPFGAHDPSTVQRPVRAEASKPPKDTPPMAEPATVDAAAAALMSEVPDKAADAVAWIEADDIDQSTRVDRAHAAEAVEVERGANMRSTVVAAIDGVLRPAPTDG